MLTKEKQKVKVGLFNLHLIKEKNTCYGRVVASNSMDMEDFVRIAADRRTDLSPTSIRSSVELVTGIAIEALLSGASVKFGLGIFQLGVNGVFHGEKPHWDSNEHQLIVNAHACAEVREAVKNCEVEVTGMVSSIMVINTVEDVESGTRDEQLTPGGGVNINGVRIKIEGEHADVGLKLVNNETKEEVKIANKKIMRNTPSQITFIVPTDLAAGEYRVKVTTQYSTSKHLLKDPRTVIFNFPLTVS